MDAVPIIEVTALAREVIRNSRGTVLGVYERQSLTGKIIARNAQGLVVGSYDPRSNETRDSRGRVVGRGNLLSIVLIRDR
jgi:hypothetical protein